MTTFFQVLYILLFGLFCFWLGHFLQQKQDNKIYSKKLKKWDDELYDKELELAQRKRDLEGENKVILQNKIVELQNQARRQIEEKCNLLKEKWQIEWEQQTSNIRAKTKKEIDFLEQQKQIIERAVLGYGLEYIIPNNKLIDDLGEKYSYNNAGEKLKECRNKLRKLMKQYQKSNWHFIVLFDLFNTKAEMIIEKTKEENYGILKQEMEDLFNRVNSYGQKINSPSVIHKEFYELRQSELKWVYIIQTLKASEREEQRAFREAQKEREKAEKEYQKALKEAQAEQEAIQRKMQQLQEKMALQMENEKQRLKFEAEIALLNQRLVEAEEKNQRAVSMAQQTKSGHVYIISNIGSFGENMVKIGMTRRLDPLERVRELGSASVPFLFDVHAVIYAQDAPSLEKKLHHAFAMQRVNKVNPRKEFFRIKPSEIRQKLTELGIEAHFTLSAEASEYRETLRIEQMNNQEQAGYLLNLLNREIADED